MSNEETPMSYYAILRKTTFNGNVIEADTFMGIQPDEFNAINIVKLFNDDVKVLKIHALRGFGFEFYWRYYE